MGKYDANTAQEDSSPSAKDYWAVEGEDAPADNPGFYPSSTLILVWQNGAGKPLCRCGCELQLLNPTKGEFRQGHDARLKGKLQRAHVRGHEVAVVDGGTLTSMSAMQFVTTLRPQWERFLTDYAVRAERDANKATVKRSRQTLGGKTDFGRESKTTAEAVGKLDLLNRMKAAGEVLKAAGRYGKSAGDRRIEISGDNVDSILDGTHPLLADVPRNDGAGIFVGQQVPFTVRGTTYTATVTDVKGDRAEITYETKGGKKGIKVVELATLNPDYRP